MAHVSSMTYTSEAQFTEAVEQIKAARLSRESFQASRTGQQASFQDVFAASLASSASAHDPAPVSPETLETYFQQAASAYGISVDLLKAVAKQESGFQTDIVSSAGAIGVMQLMPATASYLGVSNPYDPQQNIMGGAKLLSELSAHYNGDLSLTLAAYNAGIGIVDQCGAVPPIQETQHFVSAILTSLGQ